MDKELENGKIIITNDEGEQQSYDVLFTFDSDETKKSYVAYTDNTTDESGNIRVYASTYDPDSEELYLEPLTTEKEWKVIEQILSSVQEKVKETQTGGNDEESGQDN